MGLAIVWEGELGNKLAPAVEDPGNVLRRILPSEIDESYPLLRYIDPYGSTTFNRIQVKDIRKEWARIRDKARSVEQRDIIDSVARLMEMCVSDLHTYIRFIGD